MRFLILLFLSFSAMAQDYITPPDVTYKDFTICWDIPATRVSGAALDITEIDSHTVGYTSDSGATFEAQVGATQSCYGVSLGPGIYEIYVATTDTDGLRSDPGYATSIIVTTDTVSASDSRESPQNAFDGDVSTRWSATGEQWIQYELGALSYVSGVKIMFYKGAERSYNFDIELSEDGITYESLPFASDLSNDWQLFGFSPRVAKYIRYSGTGNSANEWSSIIEMQPVLLKYSPTPEPAATPEPTPTPVPEECTVICYSPDQGFTL